jgi:flagellar hook-associated protein 3 FlgL
MEQGVVSTDTEQHQVNYNSILDQLSTATSHMTSRQVDAGVRLQVLENQESRHLDSELSITTGKAKIEDLDFAKAISQFEQSKIALQASQQAFSKVQGLTLFNYI